MSNLRVILRYILISGLLSFSGLQLLGNGELRIVGSDLVGDILADRLLEIEESVDFDIKLILSGSLLGKVKMHEGLADVALIVEQVDGVSAQVEGHVKIPIGFWGIYLGVSHDNPILKTNVSALRDVVEATYRGKSSSWQLIAGDDSYQHDRLVFLACNVEATDAAFPVFLKYFLGNKRHELKRLGGRIEDLNGLGDSVLVLLSYLPTGNELKLLGVSANEESPGFPPSAENMYYGDYPLSTSFYLLLNKSADERARRFVQEFLDDKTLKLLDESGLIFASKNVQKQALLEVDLEF